jgi:ABC-type bacteriocin/lantibiotic exporter with double-glycine peptidase domain
MNKENTSIKSYLHRVWEILSTESQNIFAVICYGILVSLLSLTVPVAVQALVNSVAYGHMTQQLLLLSILVFLVLSLSGFFSAIQIYYVELLQRRLFTRYALDLAVRIPRLAHQRFNQICGAEFVNPFLESVIVHKSLSILLLEGLGLFMQIVVGVALLGAYHPFLLLFALILIGVIATIFTMDGKRGIKTADDECTAKYEMLSWLEDMARMPILFHSAYGETFGLRRADDTVRGWLDARRNHFRIIFRQNISMFLIHAVASSLLLGLGGVLVIRGQLSLGQLVAAEIVLNAALSGLSKFGKHLESFYDLTAAVKKLDNLRNLPLEMEGQDAFADNHSKAATLNIRNLEVSFEDSDVPLLSRVNLSLDSGDRACIYGLGSSGKTVLLDCVYGLFTNYQGQIQIDGYNLEDITRRSLRTRVALLGEPDFFHGTMEENLIVGSSNVSRRELRELIRVAGLEGALARIPKGLDAIMLPHSGLFSSSELVRFSLIRAILSRPGLILLDRSLDTLDEQSLQDALNILRSLGNSSSVLAVTNRPEVLQLFPRKFELSNGTLNQITAELTSPQLIPSTHLSGGNYVTDKKK